MAVSFVYHHHERSEAIEIAKCLEKAAIDYVLAPIGLEVGSVAWIEQVEIDLRKSDISIALISPDAICDEWFLWRINLLEQMKKHLIPILIREIESLPYELMNYQYIDIQAIKQSDGMPRLIAIITRIIEWNKVQKSRFSSLNIFISYSRSDVKFVQQLVNDLREAGIFVWRDEDSIPKGALWDAEIQKALNTCTQVLLIATPRSVESTNVLDEIGYALNKQKPVIPIFLEECELPLRIHRAQWVNFLNRAKYDDSLNKLLRYLETAQPQ